MKELQIHPLADLMPRMPEADFRAFIESVRAEGRIFEPIVCLGGAILDGRHRYWAARKLSLTVPVAEYEGDRGRLVEFVLAKNLHRRHLGESQRAMVAARLANLGDGRPSKKTTPIGAVSKQQAADLLHVGRGSVERAKTVLQGGTPALVKAVEAGEITVSKAASQVRRAKREAKDLLQVQEKPNAKGENGAFSIAAWAKLSDAEKRKILDTPRGSQRFNEQKTEAIDWAKWSWNPVTGCKHNCPYCYARDIAQKTYPQGFAPTFLPDRLSAPSRMKVPDEARRDVSYRNVFTCSMADLFGRWVPSEWIAHVLDVVAKNEQWNFLFLTKFPKRYVEFEFPRNAWIGTTVDCQQRVKAAEAAFANVKAEVKWLSVEPMLEPLRFEDLGAFQWIVLGGASSSSKTPEWRPPTAWWAALQLEAERLGLSVYHKTNLYERDKGFPGSRVKPRKLPKSFDYLRGKTAQEIASGESA